MELNHRLLNQVKQTLAITPSLIQSIQLLKFSHEDLYAYLREQEEKNPLIEVVGGSNAGALGGDGAAMPADAKTGRGETATVAPSAPSDKSNLHSQQTAGFGASGEDPPGLEETLASPLSLREHLLRQVELTFRDPGDRIIATEIVEEIDPDGYLRGDLDEIADTLGADLRDVEAVLEQLQTFEPAGVGARSLAECLRLQLSEADRITPEMDRLLENLELLAAAKFERLASVCGVSVEQIAPMAQTIRQLDPRPGLQFHNERVIPAMPDLKLNLRSDGTFQIEMNSELLPKLLIDREYYAELSAAAKGEDETRFVVDCLKDANWLTRNLDQRANTILKVATEIVKQQKKFFQHGVAHIKPLCQGDIADAVGLHRSTVCRATSGKYIMCNRGLFELNFFFSNAITSADGDENHSAESVRAKIRDLIEAETAQSVLSDDAITTTLQKQGVQIARRTVAKYREMMNFPSSQIRKRQKRAVEIENGLCPA